MRILLSTCLTLSLSFLLAQVPQAMKYQAVARDSMGSIMENANITVRVSILDSAAGGGVVYSEIHKTGTNQFGLFSISIGRGIQPNGLFANIDWATGSKWMQLEMSQNNGSTFQFVGASELLSVPYALYAETSNTPGPAGPQGVGVDSTVDNGNGTFSFFYSDGSIFTTSNLTGPSGPAGAAGPQGPRGIPGAAGANVDVFSAFHGLHVQTLPTTGSIVQRFDSVTINTDPGVFVDNTGSPPLGTEITINRTGRFMFLITLSAVNVVPAYLWYGYLEEDDGSGWHRMSKSAGTPNSDIQVVVDVTSGNRYRVSLVNMYPGNIAQNIVKHSRITIYEMVGAEGPPGPQGVPGPVGPQGPHGQSDSTFFNPLYPDGTLGMVGVTHLITNSTPYVVPAGKNFYLTHSNHDLAGLNPTVNGIAFRDNFIDRQSFIIAGAGDTISKSQLPSDLLIFGYLIDAAVTPVNVDLKNGSYVVPNGKQLFVNYCVAPKDPNNPKIQVNGIGSLFISLFSTLPIILNSGDVVSITPTTWDTLLNGYLK